MALPGHRRTSSDKRRRAAHFALDKANLAVCKDCGKPVRSHFACAACGAYNGRKALAVKSVADRVLKRNAKKAEKPASKKEKTPEKAEKASE